MTVDEWKSACSSSTALRRNEKVMFREVTRGGELVALSATIAPTGTVLIGFYFIKDKDPSVQGTGWAWND